MSSSTPSSDAVKAQAADLEAPKFEATAFTSPPPLSECTVALVTSASLHHPEQEGFAPRDTSFRRLDPSRRDYQLGHWSQDVDQVGYGIDYNVVFPIDRLFELAESGVIGKVADVHLAYAGNQFEVSGIRMDSGPEGAQALLDAGVDVVVLTPV